MLIPSVYILDETVYNVNISSLNTVSSAVLLVNPLKIQGAQPTLPTSMVNFKK